MTGQREYVGELRRLADVCRALAESEAEDPVVDLDGLSGRVHALESEIEELRASRQLAVDTSELLQRRVAVLEKSLPPPQLWRDLIRGIGAVRETVTQMQKENTTCHPA